LAGKFKNYFNFRGDGNDVVPNFDWILAKEKGPQTPVSSLFGNFSE